MVLPWGLRRPPGAASPREPEVHSDPPAGTAPPPGWQFPAARAARAYKSLVSFYSHGLPGTIGGTL